MKFDAIGSATPRPCTNSLRIGPRPSSSSAGALALQSLVAAMTACRVCRDQPAGRPLGHEPRPIFRVSSTARIVIASQAPGMRAHTSGIPFDDASGQRLRSWLGLEADDFYDSARLAIIPMGFCFPGYDAHGGDLPPRPECRPRWHDPLFAAMPQVELILAIGVHAIRYHVRRLGLAVSGNPGMAELVLDRPFPPPDHGPRLIPLPHPSWRNTAWLKRNPRFEADILPPVRAAVRDLMG